MTNIEKKEIQKFIDDVYTINIHFTNKPTISEQNKNSVCLICKKTNIERLGNHLYKKHNVSSKNYYDTYFKEEEQGYCKNCRKQTQFRNIENGYKQFCSTTCQYDYRKIKNKTKNKKVIQDSIILAISKIINIYNHLQKQNVQLFDKFQFVNCYERKLLENINLSEKKIINALKKRKKMDCDNKEQVQCFVHHLLKTEI